MKNKTVYLAMVLECIGLINEYVNGYDLEEFLKDRKTQDAVIRNLEIIGQALKDYGVDSLNEKSPGFPWQKVAAMRNVLTHEYLGVDLTLIWGTLSKDLVTLTAAVEEIV